MKLWFIKKAEIKIFVEVSFFRQLKCFPERWHISMARTSLGTWKFVLDMGSLNHWGLTLAPCQQVNGHVFSTFYKIIQSNLVISNSLISNYRLSRSENLVPALAWNYEEQFLLFSTIFSVYVSLFSGVKLHIHLWNVFVWIIFFLKSANLIHVCRDTDISKYFRVPWTSR